MNCRVRCFALNLTWEWEVLHTRMTFCDSCLQSLVKDETDPYVHVERMSLFPCGRGLHPQTKPQGLSVDDVTWSTFTARIDPHARSLHRGRLVVWIILCVVLGVGLVDAFTWALADGKAGFSMIVGAGIATVVSDLIYTELNNRVGKRIEESVNDLQLRDRFRAQGYGIQYLTKDTGRMCTKTRELTAHERREERREARMERRRPEENRQVVVKRWPERVVVFRRLSDVTVGERLKALEENRSQQQVDETPVLGALRSSGGATVGGANDKTSESNASPLAEESVVNAMMRDLDCTI
mmetsp:Transcript_11432/g.26927  ORF Transcript_11432/g.26927 Transcript_11432/m.26927 type:complete len:296 (+) Transcript_11432:281-1168(+)